MDISTGNIYELEPDETLEDMAKRLNLELSNLVQIARKPSPTCQLCRGKGFDQHLAIEQILLGEPIKPCRCTLEEQITKGE